MRQVLPLQPPLHNPKVFRPSQNCSCPSELAWPQGFSCSHGGCDTRQLQYYCLSLRDLMLSPPRAWAGSSSAPLSPDAPKGKSPGHGVALPAGSSRWRC